MKLKYTLEIVNMGDELIAVPVGENASKLQGVVKVNKEGREILEMLNQDVTEEKIVTQLGQTYDNSPEELGVLVHNFICKLKSFDLLDD